MSAPARCPVCGQPRRVPSPCDHCGGRLADRSLERPLDHTSNPFRNFASGLGLFLAGCRYGLGEKRLRLWIVLPAILSVVLFILLAGALIWLTWKWPDQLLATAWVDWLEWLRGILATLLQVLLVPIVLLVALITSTVFSSVVNSPILDHLAARTEELAAGRQPTGPARPAASGEDGGISARVRSWITPTLEALKLALFELAVTAGLTVASLLSGGMVSFTLPIAASYFATLTALDYIMTRKDYRLREKIDFAGRSLAFHLGFGVIPSLLPFLLPLSVVAATRAYLRTPVK